MTEWDTHFSDIFTKLAVEEAPVFRWLNVELRSIEPPEDFLLDFNRRPLLYERAVHDEMHRHGPLVEVSRHPVVTSHSLDGIAKELPLAIVPSVGAEVGGLIWEYRFISEQHIVGIVKNHCNDKNSCNRTDLVLVVQR